MQFAVLQTSLIGIGGGFNSSRWSSTLCLMRKWLLQVFVLHIEGGWVHAWNLMLHLVQGECPVNVSTTAAPMKATIQFLTQPADPC